MNQDSMKNNHLKSQSLRGSRELNKKTILIQLTTDKPNQKIEGKNNHQEMNKLHKLRSTGRNHWRHLLKTINPKLLIRVINNLMCTWPTASMKIATKMKSR